MFEETETIKQINNVTVRYFKSRVLRRLYRSAPMADYLRHGIRRFDVVHIHAVFLWPTWAAAHQAMNQGVPYVISPRGMLVPELIERKSRIKKSLSIRFFDRRVVENAASVHFTSGREEEDFLRLGLTASRSAVIPNGVDLSEIPDPLLHVRNLRERDYVVYLGRLNWKKGLDQLIKAMNYLKGPKLIIAGEDEGGYRGTLETMVGDLSLTDRIHFEGPQYGHRKWELLASASVLVLPSISENFGNVVLEAMAVGTPVVVTEGVGAGSLVQSSGAGLVAGGSARELADAISRILGNPSLASEMGTNGRSVVASEYDWDIVSSRMETLYSSVVEANS